MQSGTKAFTINRTSLSSWLLVLFIAIIVASGAISEFFQTPKDHDKDILRHYNIFNKGSLASISSLEIKNSFGTFYFRKVGGAKNSSWDMVRPRNLTANGRTIDRVISAIESMRILKVYQKDPINMANYSLHAPLIRINLGNTEGRDISISMGLVNPIDNSTYITMDNKEFLYNIEQFKVPITTLNLYDLIETTIFPFDSQEVSYIKLYRGNKSSSSVSLSAFIKDGKWTGRRNRELDIDKVNSFLGSLASVRSSFILDSVSEKLAREIKRYSSRPLYTMEVIDSSGREYNYIITNALPKLSDVKMEKWKSFLITGPSARHPYLVSREKLRIFSMTDVRLRKR